MTTSEKLFEARLQLALQDLADEVQPVPWLGQPRAPARRPGRGRRNLLIAAAAVVALVVGLASISWLRSDGPRLVEPVQRPPKVFRLTDRASDSPGPAMMAVILTDRSSGDQPTYLLPAGGGPVTTLPPSPQIYGALSQRLSLDGRLLVRQDFGSVGRANVVIDLASGRVRPIDDPVYFLALSPDGSTAAEYARDSVVLADLRSGTHQTLRRLAVPVTPVPVGSGAPGAVGVVGSLGWSPDGSLLAMKDGPDTLVLDRGGRLHARFPHTSMVNGSQSWRPDSRSLLVYDGQGPTFSVRHVDGTTPTVLGAPPGADRPLGWAGSRVVWLTGAAGNQRLVVADEAAEHPETWMRLDVGTASVLSVTWSSALAGTGRR
jgi:hypothetical protein